MNSVNIAGIISLSLLVIAAVLLLINFREGRYSFLALAFYLAQIVFLDLISTKVIPLGELTTFYIGTVNNLLDAPLILVFLLYFSKSRRTNKLILFSIGTLLLYDITLYFIMGLTNQFLTFVIGPGLFIVTAFAFYFFVDRLKAAMYHRKEVGKAFISGGLVFTYACFLFIYLMFYVLQSDHLMDIYMIYHITYIVLAVSLILGIAIIMKARFIKPKPAPRLKKEDPNAFQYL
jgi:F0F1-type ATP synthase assembly protein I